MSMLRTSAANGNIFLAWGGESWLEEYLEFGPNAGQSHSLSDKRSGVRLVECFLELGVGEMLATP